MRFSLAVFLFYLPFVASFVPNLPLTTPELLSSNLLALDSTTSPAQSTAQEPLCDLQTLLRLADDSGIDSGGSAKAVIQGGQCHLNGEVETRRAKKLFEGDVVTFEGRDYLVSQIVESTNYHIKPKKKKKVAPNGGTYRTKEWREERKERKSNHGSDEWREEQRVKKQAQNRAKTEIKKATEMIFTLYLAQSNGKTAAERQKIFARIWQTTYAKPCEPERVPIKCQTLKGLLKKYKEQSGAVTEADVQSITAGKNPHHLLMKRQLKFGRRRK